MSYNFVQKSGVRSFRPWSQWEKGDKIVGVLTQVTKDNYGKNNYELQVLEVEFKNDVVKYQTKKGEPRESKAPAVGEVFCLNANGSLDHCLMGEEEGVVVRVIYQGMDTLAKGKYAGKEFHKLDVAVANADTDESDAEETTNSPL